MSAKLLYNLSDENPNLNKQFGCMNGIFQVFHRQQYPARLVSSDVEKSLPTGETKDIVGEINMEIDKETRILWELQEKSTKMKKSAVKEKHRISSESSSRPSFSSSPRSSSFSSAEVSSITASQFDQPGEKQIREQPNAGPFDIKELVKGCINRERRTRREETVAFTNQQLLKESSLRCNEWNEGRGMAAKFKESSHRLSYDEREMRNKTGSKLKETPRLSLDSRTSPPPQDPVTVASHRRSSSSVVAKLMGLEVIADNFETEQRKGNLFCDSPRPPSRVEQPALQRSRSVDSIKKIQPASKFPMEPAPWKQMKAGYEAAAAAAPTVYGEIQKRLTQLEFKKAGKDLRALKHILEAMEKTQTTHQPVPAATTSPSPAMKQKAALPNVKVGNTRQTQKAASGKQNTMDLTPRPGQQDSTKSTSPKTLRSRQALVADSCSTAKSGRSQQKSVSPRFERQSRPTTPKPEPCKIQRQLGRKQQTESVSPRRKPRCSFLQQPDDRLSNASSDLRSSRSDSNISLGSNVTSKLRLERNCDFAPEQRNQSDFGTRQNRPDLKPLKVTVEQPSPVSVLDAAFDEDDSPSPVTVRKISLSFKAEDDALRSEESMWINKPTGVCRSILLPENKDPTHDLLECYPDEDSNFKSGDHKYISEILLASGLLRDLEYTKIIIQLNQARVPINPGLFFFLEQNKASDMTLLDNRGRGFRQQQTNLTETIRRKLIFDTVNEILAQRFTAEGCTKPRFTANPATTMEKKLEAEQLLQTLCSEIDRLQENKSKCILEEDIIWEDLQCQGMNMKGENPGIVLDIERMIFRDLVSEVCFS
ncbi:protein LONGIFOLIA 2 isoform X2 [Raphanus sativus]|uniref:Protein LONGIFOLIA 2 isoform X2 n=1 Tax=Raphanus sativus TaxID=3726 RepID=A0A6J0NM09_RAPSA|nr:protein LONGIFOLIA 2 isoform X2 [Raphanus sativus]